MEERKRELFRDELQPLTWIPFVYGYLQTVVHTDTDFGTKAKLTVSIFFETPLYDKVSLLS